jgi:hypothetical protein
MTKIYKGNMANLASMLLNADQQLGDNTGTEELAEMLEKKYGIDFDGFCSLVWDIMDYVPLLSCMGTDKQAHVLGSYIDSSTGKESFLAIVSKEV